MSSEKAIKDVLIHKQDHFSDRPPSVRGQLIAGNNDLAFGSDSEMWRYKKKQFMRAIKRHGDAQTKLESITLSIGKEMLQKMEDHGSKNIDPSDLFSKVIISNMMALAYGYSDDQSVSQIKELLERGSALLGPSGPAALLDLCPTLRFLFPVLKTTYKEVQKVGEDIEKLFGSFMNKRKEMRHAQDSKVFIDHFLDINDQNSDKLNEKDVIMIGADIVFGGNESTYFFLNNLIGILVNHPHIQDQAYQGIINAIGMRAPTFEDRQSIPYMEAIMMETLRYASITAL